METPTLAQPSGGSQLSSARRLSRALFPRGLSTYLWSYLYLAPMILLFAVFTIYPLFASLGYTLYQWNGIGVPSHFVGLTNFVQVVRDTLFWGAFAHTFIYMLVLVPVQLCLALALALVLNNPHLRFATFYRSIYFLPVVTSPAVIGVVIQILLSNFGENINHILLHLHVINSHIDWLGDPHYALGVIIAVGIWNTLGYNLVYFLAGLQTIPPDLYEASRLDGASGIRQFFFITVPMLRGVGLVILILAILGSLQVFDLVQVLTGGGPYFATEVVNTYIYHEAFGNFSAQAIQPNIGYASAASFFYGLLLLGFSLVQVIILRYAAYQRKEFAAK
jgi:ABC-type sugar transport systems, permease components